MSTSSSPIVVAETASAGRGPLRLRMAGDPGSGQLDGRWWPYSRDLAVELADLVDHFPPGSGRIVRALFSPPDWDPAPRRIPIARGYIKVGSFPRDDTHVILLTTADRTVLRVLVVPPSPLEDERREGLTASATDPMGHWTDDGGR